jgi:hypothetical protein
MPKLTLVDQTTGLRTDTSQRCCDNCGEPGVLDADRHCTRCAELAHEADAYGTAVALDLLRTTILGARAYASRRQVEQAVERALDDYDD